MKTEIEPEVFTQYRGFLEENIDPDSGLLDKLRSNRTLNFTEISFIKDKHPFIKRNSLLLQYVIDKKKYDCLINVLIETKQMHLVNYLIGKGEYNPEIFSDEWPLTESELSILDASHEVLVSLLAMDELVGRLYSNGIINWIQRDFINSKPTPHEKNEAFLDILRRRNQKDFKETIRCLHESNQSHIAQILSQGGVVVRIHAGGLNETTEDKIIRQFVNVLDDLPLEESRRILEGTLNIIAIKKGESIVLYVYCETARQLEDLREMQIFGQLKKCIQKLFAQILSSVHNTELTIDKLHITQLYRFHIKDMDVTLSREEYNKCSSYFSGGIKLRAVRDFSSEEMSHTQKNELEDILKSTKSSLKDKGSAITDKAEENETEARFLQTQKYSSMPNLEDLQYGSEESKTKSKSVELLNSNTMALSFKKGDQMETILLEDIGYKTLSGNNQAENLKEVTSKIYMSNLPFELLDSILLKCYLKCVLRKKQIMKNKDYDTIIQLTSVVFCWFQRIRRRKFKKETWRSLVVYYKRKDKNSSVYRINRQYLDQNIRLKGLVNRLKYNDCLTDVHAASLSGQNLQSGKKETSKRFRDPISEVERKTEAIQSVFRRSLCDTKQQHIAEVIENGGAVTKLDIRLQKPETSLKIRHQNLQIVKGTNEIRDRTKARSHQIEKLKGKLKQGDLEILRANQDGEIIVVWIWCKTKGALEKLQTLNKSNHIMDVFTELVKNLSYSSEERNPAKIKPKVNIDFEQFEKTVVSFSIVPNFTSRLDLETEKADVYGVTKLQNKIYVLLHYSSSVPPCVILVFEDEIPFGLQKRNEIKEIRIPTDIASIEIENSLYVSELFKCVWKIKGDEDEEKIIIWLELKERDYSLRASTLSVTRDRQLLLVGWCEKESLSYLCIFGGSEKADLLLSISLPEDIESPQHAVETSKGNFIIFHKIKRKKKEEENGSDEGRRQLEEWIWVVSEVSGDGKTILRRFIPKNEEQKLSYSYLPPLYCHLAVDSFDRVFLADCGNGRVILFDCDLQWNGILIPTEEDKKEGRKIRGPHRLFYDEEKKELIVGGRKEVFVYALNRK